MNHRRWLAVMAVTALAACGRDGADIQDRAKQAPAPEAKSLSASLISSEDLPPQGTRSLFDHLIAQNESLPYPFEKLLAVLQREDPQAQAALTLMIPKGRSLLKAQADYSHPRVLATADYQAADSDTALGFAPRGQLFLGFVENASEIEVLSYNEAAGRYEFQLVQNYCEGCIPRIVYARRAICTTCHQAGAPIFPQRPWNETNGQPEVAAAIGAARNNQAYLGLPLANPLGSPERFDELTDTANFIPVTQRAWIDGCGEKQSGVACRRLMVKLALTYLWSPAEFNDRSAEAEQLRKLQAAGWPASGIAVGESDLKNRDPLGERKGVTGFFRGLVTRDIKLGEGAKDNEDLAAFDKLPKLPLALDPLTVRAPKRVLTAQDIDGAYGLSALLSESDFKALEKAAGYQLPALLASVDRMDAGFFAPGVFSRVKFMNTAMAALGSKQALAYCCLDTSEMSPPVATGVPPVKIAEGSVLKEFEHYCFACHRGNPSKRLDFMAGATEAEVLEHIKAKAEIRDALDWERYKGTDKENKLMPPADSHQRAALQAALAKDPKLLERMRAVVPGLFDF